ncbi:hypothetical protein [Aeromicrobium sp.]|uniref:hypothetical protein n=1 Tax=Aeromicrobium sp. TaxID=1871063 RepID=UPI0030C129BA
MRMLAVALLLVLTGCGGGSDGKAPATDKTTGSPVAAPTKATIAPPSGTPAPEALSKFRCDKSAKGPWRASGQLSNVAKTKAKFQVTIYIGQASGGQEQAKTTKTADVAPGRSVRFVIDKVPAAADGGPCRVQVLVTK